VEPEDDEAEPGAPAWMTTFGDLMSILLCFFVLLVSVSTVDIIRFEAILDSLRGTFGTSRPEEGTFVQLSDRIMESLTHAERRDREDSDRALEGDLLKAVQRVRVAGSVEVESGEGGVRVIVDGDLLFAPGSAAINPRAFIFLDELGAVMRAHDHKVAVEGHTDSTPVKRSYPGNFHLSSSRALAVLLYFVDVTNLPPDRVSAVAYGDTRPRGPNTTPEGRSRNRRVEFFFKQRAPNR
jgi:chemotaxis protein MotB